MNLLKLFLLAAVTASAAAVQSARAADSSFNPGADSPAVSQEIVLRAGSIHSLPYSFADIFNMTVGAPHGTVLASAASYAPEAAAADPAPGPAMAQAQPGEGVLLPVAEVPEPAGWVTLLSGFLVMAFMARRKTSLAAG